MVSMASRARKDENTDLRGKISEGSFGRAGWARACKSDAIVAMLCAVPGSRVLGMMNICEAVVMVAAIFQSRKASVMAPLLELFAD